MPIYLDHAATTPLAPEVIEAITQTMTDTFGNPSSVNYFGREAKAKLEHSRKILADSINAKRADEIIFTSGGSESDNTAIIQTALARQHEGKHLITTAIEHEAVLRPMEYLASLGFEITYLPVDEFGKISLADLKAALRDDTILVSIMTGNNEVGSMMPIQAIGEMVAPTNAWFHTDAVQAYGILPIDVQAAKIDLLSTSAHKLNGPKFLGFLYKRDGLQLPSLIKGGDQELKRRAGTENVSGIVGFAKAVELLDDETKAQKRSQYQSFKEQLVKGLTAEGIDFAVNGGLDDSYLPHVISIWFKGQLNDRMLIKLDLLGIAASAGSACTAGNTQPSHVLTALYGDNMDRINGTLRFSFGKTTTGAEIDTLIQALTKIIKK